MDTPGKNSMFDRRFPQILAVFTGTLAAISDGMHYGWTAPVMPILRNATRSPVILDEHHEYWLEHLYMIGGFAGLPLTIYCVDKIGRKGSILFAAVQNLISWILIGSAQSVEQLYIARLIAGIAGDVAFVAAPMYIGEIADQRIRGSLGGVIYLMMLVGIVIVYSVAPFVSIAASSMVGASFVILQLLSFPFMPESPYFLLLKCKQPSALKALHRLRPYEDVTIELEDISAAVKRQSAERGRPIDLLIVDSNRKALTIMLVLTASQHFSSISVMLMNIHTILGDAAATLPPNTAAIIFSVIMLVAASCSALLVDKVGRKILLTSSSLLTGASLLALAIYFAVKNNGVNTSRYSWIPVVSVMMYAAAFKYGLGLIPIVMTAELFPTSVKAMGMTIADASYVLFGMLSIVIYQQLLENYGMQWPFFVFSASCIFTSIFTAFYIPETKGRTLEEIQFILKGEPASSFDKSKQYKFEEEKLNDNTGETGL